MYCSKGFGAALPALSLVVLIDLAYGIVDIELELGADVLYVGTVLRPIHPLGLHDPEILFGQQVLRCQDQEPFEDIGYPGYLYYEYRGAVKVPAPLYGNQAPDIVTLQILFDAGLKAVSYTHLTLPTIYSV